MQQRTLKNTYSFTGKGLHTGKTATVTLRPASVDTGIRFRRTDVGQDAFVDALAENVTNTARSTTISSEGVSVVTIEHLMSAMTGLGIDNVQVDIDNEEVPILDGSARFYIEAICKDGLQEQDAPRKYIEIKEEIIVKDEAKGSFVRITPSDECSYECMIDFNSKVLGVQKADWSQDQDFSKEIGKCRTFVFFHEIEYLLNNNLIKGGDVDNAIVIVEYPVTQEQLDNMCGKLGKPSLKVTPEGYLDNLKLSFSNECARHKLLDLIGDLRLAGGFLKAKVSAEKSGHRINTETAKAVRRQQ